MKLPPKIFYPLFSTPAAITKQAQKLPEHRQLPQIVAKSPKEAIIVIQGPGPGTNK